ncbi:retrovirus-related pol polyprotein from transposon TNT 1-94 [Tanacetum coccineum]
MITYNDLSFPLDYELSWTDMWDQQVVHDKEFNKGAIPSKTAADAKAQLNSHGREIKKVNEKAYAALVGCQQCKGPHYTKDYPLKEEEKKGSYGPKFLEANLYEASHIDNSIPRKEKDPRSFTLACYINNVCFDNPLADLGASVSVMHLSTYLNLCLGKLAHTKLTVELADRTVKYQKGIVENVLVGVGKFVFPVDFIILDMPEDVNVPLILGRPFLSTAYAKIDVFKRKITLRVGDEKIIFKSVKPASSLIKRVYISLNLLYGDYIELNDLNVPLELRRDQVDDLMPTIEEVENIDGYRDQDMGDIILGEPFCKASCVEARRFDRLITIHNGSDNVTYQMARSHLSNSQRNKIKPLLEMSVHDKLNGI